MKEQEHLIQKFVFDIKFDSESKLFDFQKEFSSYAKEKLLPLTDKILTKQSSSKNIRINKLEIDLGAISYDMFREEIYRKLEFQLIDKLKLLLSGFKLDDADEIPQVISIVQSRIQAIQSFFETGILPWSARNNAEYNVNEIVNTLILEKPTEAKKLFKHIIPKSESSLRIIRQLDEAIYWKILTLFYKTQISSIQKWIDEIILVYLKRPIIRNSPSEFKELCKLFLLQEAFTFKTSKWSKEEFTNSLFLFFSRKANCSHVEVALLFFNNYVIYNSTIIAKEIAEVFSQKYVKNEEFIGLLVASVKKSGMVNNISQLLAQFPQVKNSENNKTDTSRKKKDVVDNHSNKDSDKVKNSTSDFKNTNFQNYESELLAQMRKEKLENVQNYVRQFFLIAPGIISYSDFNKIRIDKVAILLKELIVYNPAFVRRMFFETKFDIKFYLTQQLIELFDEDLQTTLINEVFRIDLDEFEKVRNATEVQLLLSFLKTGFLPIELSELSWNKKKIEELFILIINELINDEQRSLIEENFLASDNKEFKIVQFKKFLGEKSIKKFFPKIHKDGLALAREKGNTLQTEREVTGQDELTTDELAYFLEYYFKHSTLPSNVKVSIEKLIELLIKKDEYVALLLFNSNEYKKMQAKSSLDVKAIIQPVIDKWQKELDSLLKETSHEETIEILKDRNASTNGVLSEPIKTAEIKKVNQGEPIYINNAGLVIFHPYLSMFFKKLGLIDKKEFRDEFSAHKAVHLLQYLANKSLKSEEHELILNKIICGIEPGMPILRNIEISEEEKEVCESLIEGVIQNWTILKKTSPDNFRTSFLIREGRLLLEPQGWKLRVEERGYDVLVEKLPWSISMVKLPWMKTILYTEWK